MDLSNFILDPVTLALLILGLVEIIKKFWRHGNLLIIICMIIGIVLGVVYKLEPCARSPSIYRSCFLWDCSWLGCQLASITLSMQFSRAQQNHLEIHQSHNQDQPNRRRNPRTGGKNFPNDREVYLSTHQLYRLHHRRKGRHSRCQHRFHRRGPDIACCLTIKAWSSCSSLVRPNRQASNHASLTPTGSMMAWVSTWDASRIFTSTVTNSPVTCTSAPQLTLRLPVTWPAMCCSWHRKTHQPWVSVSSWTWIVCGSQPMAAKYPPPEVDPPMHQVSIRSHASRSYTQPTWSTNRLSIQEGLFSQAEDDLEFHMSEARTPTQSKRRRIAKHGRRINQ